MPFGTKGRDSHVARLGKSLVVLLANLSFHKIEKARHGGFPLDFRTGSIQVNHVAVRNFSDCSSRT